MTDSIAAPLRPHEDLQQATWPELEEVDRPSVADGDTLILCAGFEERAAEVIKRICAPPVPRASILLVEYQPTYPENRSEEIRGLANDVGLQLETVQYDRRNPAGVWDNIATLNQNGNRLWIDVSGMSRLLIVQTLVAALRQPARPVGIIYVEAKVYPPSKEEFKSADRTASISYLSTGVFEITVAPELSSVAMLGEATRLIAFPSFDPSQLSNVLDELQPTYTDLVHGMPPRQENEWRRRAVEDLHGTILQDVLGRKDHQVSTLDYRKALQLLVRIYDERNSFDKLVICPTGSKMQAVAVGLFRARVTDVQIVYPTPKSFVMPEKYTVGVRSLYQIQTPQSPSGERQ